MGGKTKQAAPKAPKKQAAPKGGIVLIAPEDVTSFGCAAGTFDVSNGRLIVPPEALNDALGSGFELDPEHAPPEVEGVLSPPAPDEGEGQDEGEQTDEAAAESTDGEE